MTELEPHIERFRAKIDAFDLETAETWRVAMYWGAARSIYSDAVPLLWAELEKRGFRILGGEVNWPGETDPHIAALTLRDRRASRQDRSDGDDASVPPSVTPDLERV